MDSSTSATTTRSTPTGGSGPAGSEPRERPPGDGWTRRAGHVIGGALRALERALGWGLSRRGLGLVFLAVMAALAVAGWVRPPISNDIRGFQLPLLGSGEHGPDATKLLYGPRPFIWLSPGVVLLGLVAVGVLTVALRPGRFSIVAGLLLCGGLAGLGSALLNHPELIELLDRQYEQRGRLVWLLENTTDPALSMTDSPRVRDAPNRSEQRITLLAGRSYLRNEGLVILLPALALMLTIRGPLRRRLGYLAVWCVAGFILLGAVSARRLRAEWHWQQAVDADLRGRTQVAAQQAATALARFSELARLEGTWIFLGKLDDRGGRATPPAAYFRARRLADNGELERAVGVLEDLVRARKPATTITRWAASHLFDLGFTRYRRGQDLAAQETWQRALELDPTQEFMQLHATILRARVERHHPEGVAAIVDPLLPRLTEDRALRAALLAMLGDAYFRSGQFAEARSRYEASLEAYGLPKHINHRAQRGLLGM